MSIVNQSNTNTPIALFIPALNGGGAQKVVVNLANAFTELVPNPIHVVLARKEGVFLDELLPSVTVIDLQAGRTLKAIIPLAKYLADYKPAAMMSSMHYANIVAVAAHTLARSRSRLVLREATVMLRRGNSLLENIRFALFRKVMHLAYGRADLLIGNTKDTLDSLQEHNAIPSTLRTQVIHNPIAVGDNTSGPIDFLPEKVEFICAIGRLVPLKGFDVLIQAFAKVESGVHLVILGEGSLLNDLKNLACDLGIADKVHFPGFVKHPEVVLAKAKLFVLSSHWEGFGNVIVEALALGVPVVSTDCPGGPRYILEDGKRGGLVPPGDPESLASAIEESLKSPVSTFESRKLRAADFDAVAVAKVYLEALIGTGNKEAI